MAAPRRRLERLAAALAPRPPSPHHASAPLLLLEAGEAPLGCVAAPRVTSDAAEARSLLERHGASILRTGGRGLDESAMRKLAAQLPRRIFGDSLSQHKMPERIAGGGWDGRQWVGHACQGPDRSHLPNAAHMDSPPFGDVKSDYFLMCFAETPTSGGESYSASPCTPTHPTLCLQPGPGSHRAGLPPHAAACPRRFLSCRFVQCWTGMA